MKAWYAFSDVKYFDTESPFPKGFCGGFFVTSSASAYVEGNARVTWLGGCQTDHGLRCFLIGYCSFNTRLTNDADTQVGIDLVIAFWPYSTIEVKIPVIPS